MPLGIEQLVRGVHARSVRGLFHGKGIQHGFQCVDKGKRPRCGLYVQQLRKRIVHAGPLHVLRYVCASSTLPSCLMQTQRVCGIAYQAVPALLLMQQIRA